MSEKKELSTTENVTEDKELDDLLDSALEDFSQTDKSKDKSTITKDAESKPEDLLVSEAWTEDFIRQAASQFETNMAGLLTGIPGANEGEPLSPEQVQQSLHRMAEAAAQVVTNPTVSNTDQSNDFSRTISQTLQGLSQGTENLQNPFNEQDLMNMFGGLGVSEGEEQGNAFLPIMQGMMQSLLSKDVLYPSLKDIVDRFPAWIEENKDKVDPNDLERFKKQQQLMITVCTELENETESDSVAVKQGRFEKVLILMQKLQDFGQPPPDLVGEMGPGMQFDSQGNPVLPGGMPTDPNQCSIM